MYRIYLISTYHCPPAQCDIHRGRDQMTKLFIDHWTSLDVTWSYLISWFSKTFTNASIRDLNNNSIWNWTNTHIDPNIILLRKTVSQETPVCRLPGYWGQVGGCRMPRKQTNYGNPTHQPKVMFTFGVNSVCACALAYLCVHWSLGKEFNAWACLCEYGLFAYLREHKKQRCKAEVPKISQKSLWKCHKGISWMSVGLWEMGFDTTQSWLGRVGGYMAIVAQLWLVEHLRFYDLLPFGALGYSRVPTT